MDADSENSEDDLATFDRASEMFDSATRHKVLRFLLALKTATAAQIKADTNLDGLTVSRHLNALEDLGVIAIDLPRGHRRGRQINVSLNDAVYRALHERFTSEMALRGR